jgi:hypothetical protein
MFHPRARVFERAVNSALTAALSRSQSGFATYTVRL